MVGSILNQQAVQMGGDVLGHYDIPHTPFTAFGLAQMFLPNTRIDKDPLDFARYDLGVQWLINKYMRVAFDSQAIQYYHDQFTLPAGTFGQEVERRSVRGAARHPRVLPAPGVQILAAIGTAGASIRNARAGSRFGSPPPAIPCQVSESAAILGDRSAAKSSEIRRTNDFCDSARGRVHIERRDAAFVPGCHRSQLWPALRHYRNTPEHRASHFRRGA